MQTHIILLLVLIALLLIAACVAFVGGTLAALIAITDEVPQIFTKKTKCANNNI